VPFRERRRRKWFRGIPSATNLTRRGLKVRTRSFTLPVRPLPTGDGTRRGRACCAQAASRHLIAALSRLQRPPGVIVSASAIGYYGNRAEEELTESSAPGTDFLAKLCIDWESEVARGAQFGARVVMLRLGIILAAHGGALPRMALPFKMGVGGKLGSGRQWMSWLTLDEAVHMIDFALNSSTLTGPANAVAPSPVRNTDFTRALAKVLRRPSLFPAPSFALRLALGEMAGPLLLASQFVLPSKLAACGYTFLQADLNLALQSAFNQRS